MSTLTPSLINSLPVVDPALRRPVLATAPPAMLTVPAVTATPLPVLTATLLPQSLLPQNLIPSALSAASQKGQAPHRPPARLVDPLTRQELAKETVESQTERRKFHASSLIPWTLFAGLGVWGWGLPAVVLPLTEKVVTEFLWNFNGVDLVGMGGPRVSKALTRGSRVYKPEEDPRAQQLHGAARQLHINKERLKHANWPNLREELMREMASAPLMLMITTLGFAGLKPLSRVTGEPLATRRATELPYEQVREFGKNFSAFYGRQSDTLTDKPFREVGKAFFAQLFADEPDGQGRSLLDKPVTLRHNLGARLVDPEYSLSDRMLQHLAHDQVDGLDQDLANFRPRTLLGRKNQPKPPIAQRTTTLRELIEHWSTAMADHIELDLNGTKKDLLNGSARERNLSAQSRLNYYTRLMSDAVQVLNRERAATHGDRLDEWGIVGADGIEDQVIGSRTGMLRSLDKFRDFVATVGRRTATEKAASGHLAPDTVGKAVSTLTDRVVSEKLGLSLTFTGLTCAYMWWLAHAIQKGRAYPANDQVSLSRTAIGSVATAEAPGGLSPTRPTGTGNGTASPALMPASFPATVLPRPLPMTGLLVNPFQQVRPLTTPDLSNGGQLI